MGSLVEVIKDDNKRRAVVADCEQLIEAEVRDKSGLSGIAIKAGFATVKGLRPGMIPMAMNHLLDDFAAKVEPFWQECQAQGKDARVYFTAKKGEIANALLTITDDRAKRSSHKVLVKTYGKLRPSAIEHVGAAMPRFADLVKKHAS
ncbi:MAG: hypothetical protein H6742_18855 [Alphaproteobacteria bacterium]|nr:hypothetical protein [Alphaproteobacteria bacterium]